MEEEVVSVHTPSMKTTMSYSGRDKIETLEQVSFVRPYVYYMIN